ncbi:MAG TPA: M48 family metallopeptidase [Thermodesulfovibrionales bacterium]|nr:M48 family metallopeptidase [Thermodesulfovibrionales bacterium]
MKRLFFASLTCLLFVLSCQTVPITGRQQLNIVPSGTLMSMSFNEYSDFLKKHEVITGTPDAQMVARAGGRIQHAVERYFSEQNLSDQLAGYKWEFNLVKDDAINAWCMPGGKVVVYTGILPIAAGEDGLAVVMGHEISHAIAKHGNERMSQGLVAQMGGMALSVALAEKTKETQDLFMTAFGVGSQVGILLPYSRIQESEADRLGLVFMAMAGYDPREAVAFWKRMAAGKKGTAPPAFLSTHPADSKRIADIEKLVPEAMGYYKK